VRLVSFPCWELFERQPREYQRSVLGSKKRKKIAVEAGVAMGWEKWTGPDGLIIAMDSFGASAPAERLFEEFGFSVEKIYKKIKNHLQ